MTVLFRFVAAVALALTIGLVGTRATEAAPVSYWFELVQDGGNVAGKGSLTIDDTLFTGTGSELFDPLNGLLGFEVSIGGISFGIADDVAYPLFPVVSFDTGHLIGISYAGLVVVPGSDSFLSIEGFDYAFTDANGVETTGSVRVPEPSTLLAFATGLVLLGGIARRNARR